MQNIKYMDQTGKFPVVSSQGNRYIMVLYQKDGNLILVEPMRTWSLGEMCRAYNKLMMCLTKKGIKVKKNILNNEASRNIYNQSNEMEYNMTKCSQTFTDETSPKKQSSCSRITSKQFWQESTAHSPCTNGTDCYHKLKTL